VQKKTRIINIISIQKNYTINWPPEPSKEKFQRETFLSCSPTAVMYQNHKS